MSANPTLIHVACLCAGWCRLCDGYRATFDAVCDEMTASGVPLIAHWIDIEDEADWLGDVDVETFPTIVVVAPDGLRFAGPLTPQAETLRRVLRSAVLSADSGARRAFSPEILRLAKQLEERQARR